MTDNQSWHRPSEVFARQLRRQRQAFGWTATELADRVSAQGVPLRRQAVEEIERGTRQVRVDEAVACAAVLQTPLGVMFFGVGDVDAVGLTEATAVHPDIWQQWLEASESAPGVDFTEENPSWHQQQHPIRAYQQLRVQQRQSAELRARIEHAKDAGDRAALAKATRRFLAVCKDMAKTTADMKAWGVQPPDWYPEFLDYVADLMTNEGED